MKQPAVYILASARNGTLYVGVTSDLVKRVAQHRGGEFWRFYEEVRCAQAGAVRARIAGAALPGANPEHAIEHTTRRNPGATAASSRGFALFDRKV